MSIPNLQVIPFHPLQTPEDGKGQGSLVRYSPWGHKVLDMVTEQKQHTLHPDNDFDCLFVFSVTLFLFCI